MSYNHTDSKAEYLCSCSNCLELKVENCETLITANFDDTVQT